jgi:hypothetical protein
MKRYLTTLLLLALAGCSPDERSKETFYLCQWEDASSCGRDGNWLAVFPGRAGGDRCKNAMRAFCYEARVLEDIPQNFVCIGERKGEEIGFMSSSILCSRDDYTETDARGDRRRVY